MANTQTNSTFSLSTVWKLIEKKASIFQLEKLMKQSKNDTRTLDQKILFLFIKQIGRW